MRLSNSPFATGSLLLKLSVCVISTTESSLISFEFKKSNSIFLFSIYLNDIQGPYYSFGYLNKVMNSDLFYT